MRARYVPHRRLQRVRTPARRLVREFAAGITKLRAYEIARNALQEFSDDGIPSVAAGITFFFLLAIFPAIACVVSIYGMFAHRETIAHDLHLLSGFLPAAAMDVLKAELSHLLAQPAQKLGVGFVTGLVIAIWSASGGIRALMEGLNIAYEVREGRGLLKVTLHALLVTLAIAIFVSLLIALINITPSMLMHVPFGDALETVLGVLAWPATFVGSVVLSSLIYRYAPDRTNSDWHWVTFGGAIASAVWMAGTVLFAWYVKNFGHYDRVYGDLGSVVGFLTWIWLSMLILLLGAEINFEIERERQRPSP